MSHNILRARPIHLDSIGIYLKDSSELDLEDSSLAENKFGMALSKEWGDTSSDASQDFEYNGLCGANDGKHGRSVARFTEARDLDSGLTWDDFEHDGGTIEDDSDIDPRLDIIIFAVYHEGVLSGKFGIYNMSIIGEESGVNLYSAYGVIGATELTNKFVTMGKIYQAILGNNIEIVGGPDVKISEWYFPSDILNTRWRKKSWNGLQEMFGSMTEVVETTVEGDELAVSKVTLR